MLFGFSHGNVAFRVIADTYVTDDAGTGSFDYIIIFCFFNYEN